MSHLNETVVEIHTHRWRWDKDTNLYHCFYVHLDRTPCGQVNVRPDLGQASHVYRPQDVDLAPLPEEVVDAAAG